MIQAAAVICGWQPESLKRFHGFGRGWERWLLTWPLHVATGEGLRREYRSLETFLTIHLPL